MNIPQSYTIAKFFEYSGNPVQNTRYLNGSCPICREGNNWLKKKRLYYFIEGDYLYCHNCIRSWNPVWWIKEVSGLSISQIREEIYNYTGERLDRKWRLDVSSKNDAENETWELPSLPGECVNLLDNTQLNFYKNDYVISLAKDFCKRRRLFSALYRPKTFYVCINDRYHKNRLVIPYYDESGRIECYITRKLVDYDSKEKYLLKFNSKKPLFNLNKIDPSYPYIFIIEGPIDSMFLKNSVACSGVHLTEEQDDILSKNFPFHERIWVLDNFKNESEPVKKKITEKMKNDEKVFVYLDEFSNYKDLNEYCIEKSLDFVNPDLIVNNSFSGTRGLLKLTECN